MKIANRDAREFVQKKHPFQGNNLFAEFFCVDPKDATPGQYGYVVYSYGKHWPLFVCITVDGQDLWFENEDRHSVTTSKHRSQAHPHVDIQYALSRTWMEKLVAGGYRAIAKARVIEGVAV